MSRVGTHRMGQDGHDIRFLMSRKANKLISWMEGSGTAEDSYHCPLINFVL